LLLPVGGGSVASPKQAAALLEQIEPRVLIPIAWKTDSAKHFLPIEAFLREIGAEKSKERLAKYAFKAKDLPQEEMRVIILDPQ